MLLDATEYDPIPDRLLAAAMEQAIRLSREIRRQGLDDEGVVLSLSFVGYEARPVFWDVVWPGTKYHGTVDARLSPVQ
jgi:hypothetical protein